MTDDIGHEAYVAPAITPLGSLSELTQVQSVPISEDISY
jgi:hypothetical protein